MPHGPPTPGRRSLCPMAGPRARLRSPTCAMMARVPRDPTAPKEAILSGSKHTRHTQPVTSVASPQRRERAGCGTRRAWHAGRGAAGVSAPARSWSRPRSRACSSSCSSRCSSSGDGQAARTRSATPGLAYPAGADGRGVHRACRRAGDARGLGGLPVPGVRPARAGGRAGPRGHVRARRRPAHRPPRPRVPRQRRRRRRVGPSPRAAPCARTGRTRTGPTRIGCMRTRTARTPAASGRSGCARSRKRRASTSRDWDACVSDAAVRQQVAESTATGIGQGVNSTPTMYINGALVDPPGLRSAQELGSLIEAAAAAAGSSAAPSALAQRGAVTVPRGARTIVGVELPR